MDPSARRSVLIYNPRAGRWRTGSLVGRIVETLRRIGFRAEAVETAAAGHATVLAEEHSRDGVGVVFALGGDGTLREVAAGLLGTGTALAPLPGGTVNVLTHALGLGGNATRAAARFADATTRVIDVGRCGDQPFLMMASAGLDAHVLAHVRSEAKRRLGRFAVAGAALRQARRYGYPTVSIEIGAETLAGSFFSVSNLPFYGGPFRMAPDARMDDGLLDLVVFRGRGARATLGFALDLARGGRHTLRPDVTVRPVRGVRWLGALEAPIQLDGDVMPTLLPPLDIGLATDRLHLLVPRQGSRV